MGRDFSTNPGELPDLEQKQPLKEKREGVKPPHNGASTDITDITILGPA